jgi:hypothetical protein
MFLRVATAEGDILLKYRKIQYLNIVSIMTGTVAINRDIMLLFAAIPRWLDNPSRTTSQPCGEWNPTNISVNKIMIKALALSLRPYTISSMKDFNMAISYSPRVINQKPLLLVGQRKHCR